MNLKTDIEKTKVISPTLILIILTLAATGATICMNKVSPIMPVLMKDLKIGAAQGGLLISVFSVIGAFFAIPGGIIVQKFGTRKSGIISLMALIVGSLVGTYTTSFTPLLVTRIIEGVGMALLSICGPVVISMTFSPEKRGGAMGIFTTYAMIGQLVMLFIAPPLAGNYGWKGVWWFATIYAIVFLIAWVIVIQGEDKSVHTHEYEEKEIKFNENTISSGSVFKNKSVWFLTISLFLLIVSLGSVAFFLPTYLNLVRGMNITSASAIVGISTIVGIPCGMIGGILSDKIGSRRLFWVILTMINAIVFGIIPLVPTNKIVFVIICIGLFSGTGIPAIFAAVTEVLDDLRMAGLAMGLLSSGQNLGFTIGAAGFGIMVQSIGWNTAFYTLIPITILSGIFMIFNKRVR
ncbi:MFS transporter [Clostridium thailandense]|uniref:MFS transporter n=1 Tax=Clostridium thailandense TaxID=2794346 RepID=UPI00398A0B5A